MNSSPASDFPSYISRPLSTKEDRNVNRECDISQTLKTHLVQPYTFPQYTRPDVEDLKHVIGTMLHALLYPRYHHVCNPADLFGCEQGIPLRNSLFAGETGSWLYARFPGT
jgi:hypothetical protein